MNNELYHYGVLGMKWGIRKRSSNGDKVSKKAGKLVSKRVDKAAIHSSKKKQDQVIEEVKKQIEDDESGIQKSSNSDVTTDSEDDDWA